VYATAGQLPRNGCRDLAAYALLGVPPMGNPEPRSMLIIRLWRTHV
jgi:hypothetical protein